MTEPNLETKLTNYFEALESNASTGIRVKCLTGELVKTIKKVKRKQPGYNNRSKKK